MSVYREPEEQLQKTWYARTARERHDLSASVEAALREKVQDAEGGGESTSARALIPPRFSLRHRAIRAAPSSKGATTTRASARTKVPTRPQLPVVEKQSKEPVTSPPRNLNIITRFMKKISSSFAAQPRERVTASDLEETEQEDTRPIRIISPAPEMPSLGSLPQQDFMATPDDQWSKFKTVETPAVSPFVPVWPTPIPSSMGSIGPSQFGTGPQRLAGRNTKIRLETIPQQKTQEMPTLKRIRCVVPPRPEQPAEAMTSAHIPAAFSTGPKKATSAHIPVIERYKSRILPAIRLREKQEELKRQPVHGSGVFEQGQRDVSIHLQAVTSSSVVWVTLLSDPGPVVVQYVSLQPEVGFTVHLTAPTTKRTAFNFVVW
ncbi:hypothetical protein EI42_02638 [Thermosporothrix hazakensis]|uniref:Uncharacterized protein n=2 Tax=Thermosporothrix hazakensis TaxID=644383 RepID=A0A326UM52_THEHA|nr:hypothetical protein [Thermosporothrix hazakensis]PZW30664.1 hypothetical protein EI42_02638 [Thermosporothrix hazakensis]